MTKKSRTFLFIVIFSLFALTAPMVLLYAQGYRVDWKRGEIAKTGALYVKTAPSSADVTLNNSQKEKTSFLDGSAFIDNLLPGPYEILISKKGYRPWQKTLHLLSQEVIEAKNIVLFPEKIQFRPIAENVLAVWKTPNDKELLILRKTAEQGRELALFTIASQTSAALLSNAQLAQDPKEITWSPNGKELLIRFQKKPHYVFLALKGSEMTECVKTPCGFEFLNSAIQEIHFTKQPGVFAIVEKLSGKNTGQLSLVSVQKKTRQAMLDDKAQHAAISGDDIVWLTQNGLLKKQNRQASSSPEILLSEPLTMRRDVSYSLSFLNGRLFLKEGSRLVKINGAKKEEPVLSNVESTAVSPDGKKIVLSNDYEIFLYYLEDQAGQPARKAGDIVFLNRFSRQIGNVAWLNANYLLYSLEDRLFVSEIDNRDAVNAVEIGQFPSPALFWNGSDGILAALSENTLYRSDRIE